MRGLDSVERVGQCCVLHQPAGSRYLQVLLVVVVNHCEEDRHEDVGVDEDVDNKEERKPGAGIVCWHPGKERTAEKSVPVDTLAVVSHGQKLHDIRAVGCGDEDIEVEDNVHIAAEVWSSTCGLQISVQKHQTHFC